jgi:hypothetical protein
MSDMTLQEQQTQLQLRKTLDNGVILANIIEVSTNVVSRVAGKDIADSVNRQTLSRNVLANLVANRIKTRILKKG